jgi:hypothetical protein
MKVWMGFLLVAVLLGGREFHKQRQTRFVVLFGLAALVTLALRSYSLV